jgi:hypothetical protein
MENEFTRPRFLASYFEVMKERAAAEGWRAVLPYWVLIGATTGAVIVHFLPAELWSDKQNWAVVIAIYAAMVVINGLLLALSWSAFARVHELLVSSAEFAVFLRRAKLFNSYLFYIDWVHAAQLLALVVSAGAMFSSLIQQIPLLGHRMIMVACIASSIYAIRYAVNAVTMMHDLVWQRAIFEEQEIANSGKVVSLSRTQDSDSSTR